MRLELVWRQVLWLQTPLCSAGPTAAAPYHLVPTALRATKHFSNSPLRAGRAARACVLHASSPSSSQSYQKRPLMTPTLDVVSERWLHLRQCVAPGTELQQPQRLGHAERRHNQVGVVLCPSERLVEADGEAAVQLCHAVLQAAVPMALLHQPEANEERGQRQATHGFSAAGGEESTGCKRWPKELNPVSPKRKGIIHLLGLQRSTTQSVESVVPFLKHLEGISYYNWINQNSL